MRPTWFPAGLKLILTQLFNFHLADLSKSDRLRLLGYKQEASRRTYKDTSQWIALLLDSSFSNCKNYKTVNDWQQHFQIKFRRVEINDICYRFIGHMKKIPLIGVARPIVHDSHEVSS